MKILDFDGKNKKKKNFYESGKFKKKPIKSKNITHKIPNVFHTREKSKKFFLKIQIFFSKKLLDTKLMKILDFDGKNKEKENSIEKSGF